MTTIASDLAAALADRYRIERELGQGGMATVYLAQDLKHDRKVALKVLKPELAAVLGAERFIVEIKTTAALQHPHILPLFDSRHRRRVPLLRHAVHRRRNAARETGSRNAARRRRSGEDRDRCRRRTTTTLISHGVIHRDIKPENILLHDGRPMVADFGIALAVSAAAGGRMTRDGPSLGHRTTCRPEQATAEKEITARSDIYSLASVLYEMLTGDPPHTGSLRAADHHEDHHRAAAAGDDAARSRSRRMWRRRSRTASRSSRRIASRAPPTSQRALNDSSFRANAATAADSVAAGATRWRQRVGDSGACRSGSVGCGARLDKSAS